MKLPLFVFAVLCCNITYATNYYFSSTAGDDNRNASQAQNSNTPWQSINKLNSIFSTLSPGDSVLLKRGDTFYGGIVASRSGTAALPIVISAYGTGNKPVLSGLTTLSGWVSVGNGIWESAAPALGTKINIVLINDSFYPMGRYPNADAANKGYLTYESYNGRTQITDNELTASPNWTGAEVVIRKVRGVIDRNLITAHSGNTISYNSASTYNGSTNFGYFIQNDIRTLDQFGEWYYNPNSKKISVFFGSSSPSSYTLQASSISNLININSQNNFVFSNLSLKGSNVDAAIINNAQNVSFKNCDILFSGESAIKASYTTNFKVDASNITSSNNNGIDLAYNNDFAVITNNVINNTALFNGMGTSGDGNSTGMNIRGKSNMVEYNQIINTGYNGIAFTGDNIVMTHNYINNFCLVKDDGGGIYTFLGPNVNVTNYGRKIVKNIVINGTGAGAGTSDVNYFPALGIYLDDNSSGIEITDNTLANNYTGVFFHNSHDIIFRNNLSYNNSSTQLRMRSYDDPYGNVFNNVINNNVFYSKLPTQWNSHLISIRNDLGQFARFDSNYYCRPFDDKMTVLNDYIFNYGNSTKSDAFDLDSWKAKYSQDASSKKSPQTYPAYTINNLSTTNKFSNGAFNTDIGYINCWTPAGNCATAWNSGGKLDGGAIQIGFSSPISSNDVATTSVPVGSISNTKNYILKFSLLGAANGKSLAFYLRDNDLYTKLTPVKYVKISTSRTENEILFSLPVSASNTGLIFEVNDQYNTIWLDNIQLYEADVTIANPDNYIRFEYNPTNTSKTVTLDATYVDHKNTSFTGSITLDPFSSVVLLKSSAVVSKTAQTISFASLSNKTYGDAPFLINATASSGLPVTFTVASGPATISGSMVTLTGTGTVSIQANQPGNATYNAAPAVTQSFTVAPGATNTTCTATGTILREQWSNISGWSIASIPLQSTPSFTGQLSSFESQDVGQLYGARIRGYICAPQSGYYTFWLAGDDVLELWLSTDDNNANRARICTTNWTMFREYTKYPSQKSGLIYLQAGSRYYVEVLQKEGGGGGHSSVAWTLPNGVFQAPIPGNQLSPFGGQTVATQTISFASLTNKTFGDAPFAIGATASSGLPVSFRIVSGPATLSGSTITLTGTGTVTVEGSQAGNATFSAAPLVTQSFTVAVAGNCTSSGTILREQWSNISGWSISSIPLQTTPSFTSQLTSFESLDAGQLYGARIRGYICAPQSGNYTFWLAGDDVLELWVSTDDNPANKVKICNTNWTMFREYTKYPSQKSGLITLQSGRRYYVEVLQKEGGGGGHSSVAWTLPNSVFQAPIPGNQLSPYANQTTLSQTGYNSLMAQADESEAKLIVFPNPVRTAATVQFSCIKSGKVTLDVFDVRGNIVRHLFAGNVESKTLKTLTLQGLGLSKGTYIIRMLTNTTVSNEKITVVD